MSRRVEASARIRQAFLIAAVVLALLEAGLFASAWRLGMLLDPGNDRRAALGFVVLGTALTLQAMAIVGIAWTLVAWSRTTLTIEDDELALEHPWREWRGGWHDVGHAWLQRGWLTVQVDGQWRRWHLHCGADPGMVRDFLARLPPGAWLEGIELRRHLAKTVLPAFLVAAGAGGLALVVVLQLLDQILRAR
jgi:membrane-associated PAP2 superfamily phosphatase